MRKQIIQYALVFSAALLSALAALSCSLLERFEGGGVAEASAVVGEVTFSRDGKSHPLSVGAKLRPHDVLTTKAASKLRVSYGGEVNVFANERSQFRLLKPTEAESCAVAVEHGEYYLYTPESGRPILCHFGDMAIKVEEGTDAALSIDRSGRLAELFVLSGRALVKRGDDAKAVSSCEVVVLDAAGVSEDSAVTAGFAAVIGRFKGWVGEKAVNMAVDRGRCGVDSADAQPVALESKAARPPAAAPEPKDTVMPVVKGPPHPIDTTKPAAQKQPADGFKIEQIVGPRRIYSGEEFTLKCDITGRAAVTNYVWRFDGVGELLITKTAEPQVTAVLEKTGEFIVTCEIMGEKEMLAAQTVRVWVVAGNVTLSAGGPYAAMLNKPVKLLGNAKSHKGKIARYEWYVTHSGKPDYVLTENAAVSYAFPKSGAYKAVFAVRLSDGSAVSDTATVNVGSLRPTANAGADIAPKPGRKVKLRGTGNSPDGKIVKYEWDFDGDGVFDWSSGTSGEVEYQFKAYAVPVFKVTDTEGNTALDTMRVVICPKDMATVESGKFCVDKYEWPNQRGALPLTNVDWHEAAKACESAGKRLCAPDEWKRACRNGGDYKPVDGNTYPYGDEFGDAKCNTLGNPKSKNALMPAGAFGECAGALDVYDMSGNAAEWTASTSAKAQAQGGFYQSGADESGCESVVSLDKDKKYIYTGFRCCK